MYLKVENLHCTNGEFSLHDISFEVESGTILAVGGPNGAGKTTLIKCLFGQIKPVSGRILLNGEDIAKKSPREISRHIAVVSQEIPEPFNFTVRDVISISGYSKDKETISIMEALEKCGTPHLLDRQYSELSGGEKRLVMV
ncbi:MAG TPA: ABC transporter ATP-binding protein, partial [Thermoplasmataceae archaeon]|nr:ABC transporter ATP-binding protein [Thermoplasmataceae archaeon]